MSAASSITSPVTSGSVRQPINRTELARFFAGIGSLLERARTSSRYSLSSAGVSKPVLRDFFRSVAYRVERAEVQQRRIDRRRATGFNVFRLIEPDENKLSDIIAGLLDPRGDHGQGDLFLRLLFKQVGLGSNAKFTKNAMVQREAPTHGILKYRRRIDVLVQGGVLLAIENKLDSLEQKDQVKDYLEHLHQIAHGRPTRLIYLTPDGRSPDSLRGSVVDQLQNIGKLHCWSYQNELRAWLESCRRHCEAQKIREFLSDFMEYIELVWEGDSENGGEKDRDEI